MFRGLGLRVYGSGFRAEGFFQYASLVVPCSSIGLRVYRVIIVHYPLRDSMQDPIKVLLLAHWALLWDPFYPSCRECTAERKRDMMLAAKSKDLCYLQRGNQC